MSEVRLAHFEHHWEAEFAQGFLEDAGIASRLVSDSAGGGRSYAGLLAGASLNVASERATEARGVLEAAGVLPGDEAHEAPGILETTELPPELRADYQDLTEQLAEARKAEMRHFVRSMLGITPAALIPMVGLALEGNVALLALLCVLVVFVEGWRWIQAGRRARRIRIAMARLEEQAESG